MDDKKFIVIPEKDSELDVLETNRIIFLENAITETSVKKIVRKFIKLQEQGADPIHLYISGEGGDLFPAFWLISEIENSPVPIFTYCHTSVNSSSALIFMSGHCRIIYPTGLIMLHGISGNTFGDISNIKAQFANLDKLNNKLKLYITSKSTLTEDRINKILDNNENYFFGQDAIEVGLADQLYAGHTIKSVTQSIPEQFYYLPTLSKTVEDLVRTRFNTKQTELDKFVDDTTI